MRIPKGGIAFFDSGIGGLTVLAECVKALPDKLYYYYGDNRHAPYGNKKDAQIRRLTFRAFKRFKRLRVSAVVVACNTATAVCIDELRKRYDFPILGVEPAVLDACRNGGEVFVLTTKATNQSPRFQKLCQKAEKQNTGATIRRIACDGLAGEIERHLFDKGYDYSSFLPKGKPSAVVLGCTHYVYLKEYVKKSYHCPVFDGNEGVAKRLKNTLQAKPLGRVTTFRPFLTPNRLFCQRKRKKKVVKTLNTKTNKRSYFYTQENATPLETSGIGRIFFLGRDKQKNKETYKQMFV